MYSRYGNYYSEHHEEFFAEKGHEKLLVGLKQFIKPIVLANDSSIVGIDVGSCIGNYIQHMKDICNESNSDILCIEPNPANLTVLKEKLKDSSSIQILKCCVSNVDEESELYNWKTMESNTCGNEIAGLRSGGEKICDIYVRRLETILDDMYEGKQIVIKFIKIDTEGNDTNVIKGLGKYLEQTEYIIFECSDCLDDARGPGLKNPMKDIVDYLSARGFDTYRIGTHKLLKVNDEYWNDVYESFKFQSNCFALKKKNPLIHNLVDDDFSYRY
jgi:FkbM family methyltransferase